MYILFPQSVPQINPENQNASTGSWWLLYLEGYEPTLCSNPNFKGANAEAEPTLGIVYNAFHSSYNVWTKSQSRFTSHHGPHVTAHLKLDTAWIPCRNAVCLIQCRFTALHWLQLLERINFCKFCIKRIGHFHTWGLKHLLDNSVI